MKEAMSKIKQKVIELADGVKTPEDVLRLANTLITLSNIKTKE